MPGAMRARRRERQRLWQRRYRARQRDRRRMRPSGFRAAAGWPLRPC